MLDVHLRQVLGLRLPCCPCRRFCRAEGRCGQRGRGEAGGQFPGRRLITDPHGAESRLGGRAESSEIAEVVVVVVVVVSSRPRNAPLWRLRQTPVPAPGEGAARSPRTKTFSISAISSCASPLTATTKYLRETGARGRLPGPARRCRRGTSGPAVAEVEAEQPVHGLLRGEGSR